MSNPSNYELLSAYLDGELPAGERAHVERLLADDADCRKVYQELLALRTSLADLPRHRLDEDLGPRVIRLAEEALGEKQPAQGELTASLQAADRRARRWRTIVYPLAVAAAAVVMLIAAPRDKREQQMARAPLKDAPPAAVSAAPPPGASAPASTRHFATVQLDEVPSPSKSGKATGSLSSSRPAGVEADSTSVSDTMAADGPAQSDSRTPTGLDSNLPAESESIGRQQEFRRLDVNAYSAAHAAGKPMAAMPAGSKATLVLECTLAPAAIRDKAFDLLLARNHLAAVAAPAAGEAQSTDRKDMTYTVVKPAYDAEKKTAAQDKPLAKQKADLGIAGAEKHPPESVLVEMKAEQLVALLADLQNHPDQFLSVQLSGRPKADADQAGAAMVPLFAAGSAGKQAEGPAGASRDDDSAGSSGDSGPQRLVVLFRLSEGLGP